MCPHSGPVAALKWDNFKLSFQRLSGMQIPTYMPQGSPEQQNFIDEIEIDREIDR